MSRFEHLRRIVAEILDLIDDGMPFDLALAMTEPICRREFRSPSR